LNARIESLSDDTEVNQKVTDLYEVINTLKHEKFELMRENLVKDKRITEISGLEHENNQLSSAKKGLEQKLQEYRENTKNNKNSAQSLLARSLREGHSDQQPVMLSRNSSNSGVKASSKSTSPFSKIRSFNHHPDPGRNINNINNIPPRISALNNLDQNSPELNNILSNNVTGQKYNSKNNDFNDRIWKK